MGRQYVLSAWNTSGTGICLHHVLWRGLLAAAFSLLPKEVPGALRVNRKRQGYELDYRLCNRLWDPWISPIISQAPFPLSLLSHPFFLFLEHARLTAATGFLHHSAPRSPMLPPASYSALWSVMFLLRSSLTTLSTTESPHPLPTPIAFSLVPLAIHLTLTLSIPISALLSICSLLYLQHWNSSWPIGHTQ